MAKHLCIDIGNTRMKFGLFAQEELLDAKIFLNQDEQKIQTYLTNQSAGNIIYSKVMDRLPDILEAFFGTQTRVIELNHQTPIPISNHYLTPQTLGKDRLAAVIGAYALFPGEHCLIIDAGTCITYDFLDAQGHYWGGNISPGLQMRLDAMHHFTAKLPRPELKIQPNWLGNNTESALQNGAYYGLFLEIEGFIQKVKEKYKPVNVLLTGGDADFFAKNLKSQIFVNQNLVLIGLNKTLIYNA